MSHAASLSHARAATLVDKHGYTPLTVYVGARESFAACLEKYNCVQEVILVCVCVCVKAIIVVLVVE